MTSKADTDRVQIGISGADEILAGGLVPQSATLVRGAPGAGKTIFGLHFLTAETGPGDTQLYINLGEPSAYLAEAAESFGLATDPIEFLDLSPSGDQFQGDSTYTLFHSAEVESQPLVETIRDKVDALDPDRVVIDPVTELRHLTSDERQFRTQVLGLIDFLKTADATVILTSQAAPSIPDDDLQFLVDAVLDLTIDNGRRRLQISKFRGSSAQRGPHTVTIGDDGMRVWSRLDPTRYHRSGSSETLSSGVTELDTILSGGLTSGTVTFLSGPTGVGKTTTGLQFLQAAADEGTHSVLYSFEEGRRTLIDRAEAVNIPVTDSIAEGLVTVEEIAPDELSLDQFTHRIRTAVGDDEVGVVMIDGASGYRRAFERADEPMRELLKIGRYLRNMNVTGIITNEVHQITGSFRVTEQNVSHLADNIIVLRHLEHDSELRKVIGVLKMRTNNFENTLRTFAITEDGLTIGEPLTGLRGILTGTADRTDEFE